MDVLNIPNINLLDIDYMITYDILNALNDIINKYPILNNCINALGSFKYVLNEKDNTAKKLYKKDIKTSNKQIHKLEDESLFFTTILYRVYDQKYFSSKEDIMEAFMPIYIAIGVNIKESYKTLKRQFYLDKRTNFSYSENIKDAINHEIGHILFRLLCLDYDEKFMNVVLELMNKNYENYPRYALKTPEEFVADCFAMYQKNHHYNFAVSYIGSYIDSIYSKYESKVYFDTTSIYKEKVLKIVR
ncbi:MAG: hypothetical protein PUD07_04435 [bacterium]|nr:hypothetical protein [bacterium]